MEVRLKCFAWAREVTGAEEVVLDLPEGGTVADLRAVLEARYPVFEGRMESIAVSVNQEFAGEGTAISAGDEVALIPPISGGV
ncbi:MAG: molybdopterin converting factor subunit 1 [bacterium]|nr:molybdopterin converting factor subunit 1 [bacterium]